MRVFEIPFRSAPRLRDVIRAVILPAPPPLPREETPFPTPPPPRTLDELASQERQAIAQTLSQLRQSVEHLATRYDALVAEMRQATVELATAIAGRVVFDKLQAGEFPIEEMARQAIARLPAAPVVLVYLHPDDLELLQRRLGDEPLLPAPEPWLRIEPDATLPRGGCRAEAGEIHVLADLAGSLAQLRQQLLWSASHARSGPASAAS